MFSDDSSIENFKQLFLELKKYIELQKDYAKLDLIEKLSKLFYIILLIFILSSLSMIALFYLMFTFAHLLDYWLNNIALCFGIVTAVIAVITFIIYIFRKPLIIQPIARYLANLFLNSQQKQ